jgi:D-3-phosphoglycerate dehydrogenase / 2-oxoglutarate reductase
MAPKVLVSPRPRANEIVSHLENAGCNVVLLPLRESDGWQEFTAVDIDTYFNDADAVVASSREYYSRAVLEGSPRLRIVCGMVIGTENIDIDAATDLSIVVAHGATPENYVGVAEAIVMLTAALIKQLPAKRMAVQDGGWRVSFPGHMVRDSVIGMIGFGKIGRAVAHRLEPWGCRMLAYDPYVDRSHALEFGVELVDLDTLLQNSDLVSLQVVLTDETRDMMGEREFSLMKPGAYFINTSRGLCVDEGALIHALDSGRLAGAAIDAWRKEPTNEENPLRNHPKVIPTGHNVGHSEAVYSSFPPAAVENVLRGLRGERPLYVRNPEVLPFWHKRVARLDAEVPIT